MLLRVHQLPQRVAEAELAGRTVIVVDLLRATTTICHALAAGATCIMPFVEVAETLAAAQRFDRADILLGGERGGVLIDGFDLGNSPAEYTPERVAGKRLLFTTTNGTRALRHAHLAARVIAGAAVNRRAVVEAVADDAAVDILCAGTEGVAGRDDVLAAGAIAHELLRLHPDATTDAGADAALQDWHALLPAAGEAASAAAAFADELTRTPHGRTLITLGCGDDLPRCANLDFLAVVPVLNPRMGEITLA